MKKAIRWLSLASIGAIIAAIIISQSNYSSNAAKWDIRQSELHMEADKVVFLIEEHQPKALQASIFSLHYIDSATNEPKKSLQQPRSEDIIVSLEMLTMDCGVVSFKLLPNEQGVYVGAGIPVMPGKWLATAVLPNSHENAKDELQTISFTFDVL